MIDKVARRLYESGTYLRVALIRERRLFQLRLKSEVRTRYAQFIIKYVNVP